MYHKFVMLYDIYQMSYFIKITLFFKITLETEIVSQIYNFFFKFNI